jgi:asparagine synthase (glutamine-hydrolysing)
MGQPLPGAAAALQWRLFDAARSHTPFVLSGDGGDEVLAGRAADQIARRLRQNRRLSTLPGPLRRVAQGVAGRLGAADLAASQAGFGLERNIGGSSIFHTHDRVEILRDPGLVRPGIRRTVLEPLYQEVVTDPLNAVLHVWQRGWLAEDSLARSDRMAAKAGVEVRYPLLDGGLVAVANGLPGEAKVHPVRWKHVTKWPLREALRGHMPNGAFLERPKRSMPPLDRWLRGPGQDFLRATTERLVDDPSSLFVPSAVRRLVAEHLSGAANHGLRLWTLCLFRLWREELGV